MKNITISKVSRTGKSYKLDVVSDGFLQLIRTTVNDPDALSVVQKGTTTFYCPLCGKPECIKQTASTAFKYAFDMNIDLDRSLYREIRMCANNEDSMRNHENIKRVVELHNRKDVLKMLRGQSDYFYLIENFSIVLIKPPFSENIICPSCGSRKFHGVVSPQMKTEDKHLKSIKCPACSLEFTIDRFWSSTTLIMDQLYRNIGGNILVAPEGEKIKHIFLNYPFSITVKSGEDRKVFNYPTDYIRLTSHMQSEELLTLFRRFSKEEKIKKRTLSDDLSNRPRDVAYGVRKFRLFFPSNMVKLITEIAKDEYKNALTIFVLSGWSGEICFAIPNTRELVYLWLKEEYRSWIKLYDEIITFLDATKRLEPEIPSGSFVFESLGYPTQVDNLDDWEKYSTLRQVSMNEVIISPTART